MRLPNAVPVLQLMEEDGGFTGSMNYLNLSDLPIIESHPQFTIVPFNP